MYTFRFSALSLPPSLSLTLNMAPLNLYYMVQPIWPATLRRVIWKQRSMRYEITNRVKCSTSDHSNLTLPWEWDQKMERTYGATDTFSVCSNETYICAQKYLFCTPSIKYRFVNKVDNNNLQGTKQIFPLSTALLEHEFSLQPGWIFWQFDEKFQDQIFTGVGTLTHMLPESKKQNFFLYLRVRVFHSTLKTLP